MKVASVVFINDKFKGHDQTSQRERDGFTSSLDWAAEMACELDGRQRAKSNGIFDEVSNITGFILKWFWQAFFILKVGHFFTGICQIVINPISPILLPTNSSFKLNDGISFFR